MLKTCETCTYPFEGETCPNPACFANPSVTQAQKDKWTAEKIKRDEEEKERQRIRDIRRRFR